MREQKQKYLKNEGRYVFILAATFPTSLFH